MKLLLVCLLGAWSLAAHVGSPDVFYQGEAGRYHLLVTIRPPEVVPGVAEIEIRIATPGVRQVHIVPLRLAVRGAQLTPVPDIAKPSAEDPQFYTGSLWLMATGSWQVRIDVDGDLGHGSLAVPVPAVARRVLGMQKAVGLALLPLGLVLAFGIVSIVGACVREAQLEPGAKPDAARRRRARMVMVASGLMVAAGLWLGNSWWNSEDGFYRRYVFKPLRLTAVESRGQLRLSLEDPGWLNRRTDDLLPDHDHLMHLYVIRLPGMERVWHLHPQHTEAADFVQDLPGMPAGHYALYGDVVHADGLAETATGEIELPEIAGRPLAGDDAAGSGPLLLQADYNRSVAPVDEGFRMVWLREPAPLRASRPYLFRFRMEKASGQPANDMELYMGMQGHAAFVRDDRTVFAHVHPSGSVPMPVLELVSRNDPHAGHRMEGDHGALPAEVGFLYGFPKPGNYRIFVQLKRGGQIETGVFDARVEN